VVVDKGESESHGTDEVFLTGEEAQELKPSEATSNKIPSTARLVVIQLQFGSLDHYERKIQTH
jgi:hypothetical protein